MSSFLSRFKSKSKDKATPAPLPVQKRQSTVSQRSATTSPTFLPLDLPNPSLLDDSVLSTPSGLRRGDESSSIKSTGWEKVEEGGEGREVEGVKGKQERETKEKARLDRAIFGVEDATVLMRECGAVIRDHGEYSPSSSSAATDSESHRSHHPRSLPSLPPGRVSIRHPSPLTAVPSLR